MEFAQKTVPSRGGREVCDLRARSVDRALDVIEVLARSSEGLTLSELSRKLRIPKSATHYLIYTLLARGYLQRGVDGRHYLLGFQLVDLEHINTGEVRWRYLVTPYLRKLAHKVNLTSLASVLSDAEAVIIAKVECMTDTGGGAWLGRHLDLHCTAQGKSLIAFLSDSELEARFKDRKLGWFTSKTITSWEALRLHLAEVRRNGFAVNDEEHALGTRAVAAPIFDHLGRAPAAISVRGRIDQISDSRLSSLGAEVRTAAWEISRQIFCSLPFQIFERQLAGNRAQNVRNQAGVTQPAAANHLPRQGRAQPFG